MKKVTLLALLVFLVFCCFDLRLNAQEIINKEEGSFKIYRSEYELEGRPIKLNDGRILIYDWASGRNLIFDPKTNTIRKTTSLPLSLEDPQAVVLDNGKVLFVGPWNGKGYPKFNYAVDFSHGGKIREACGRYDTLGYDECKLKYLKENDPDLYKWYLDVQKAYELSMYAHLYDPVTEKFELSGKLNLRRAFLVNFIKAQNGKVYMYGGRDAITNKGEDPRVEPYKRAKNVEMYDPDTGKFTIIVEDLDKHYDSGILRFPLGDGRVFVKNSYSYYILNTKDNTTSEIKYYYSLRYTNLPDGNILYIAEKPENKDKYMLAFDEKTKKDWYNNCFMGSLNYINHRVELRLIDVKTGKDTYIGNIVRPSFIYHPHLETLPDGRVLIIGGSIYSSKKGAFGTAARVRGEIFDPYRSVTTFTPKLPYKNKKGFTTVGLDDGRILMYGFIKKEANLYRSEVIRKEFLIYTPPKASKIKVKNNKK